ncbi:MAG TPA: hypothetical protein VG826_18640 [Pirellulales bacterium]|nr:hypothetical protein [Pirellulales bacterium]
MRIGKRSAGYLAWLALAIVGCHAPPAMQPTKCVCTPNGPCGGYFSTCWRQWPAECTSCPPMIEGTEVVQPTSPPGGNETVPPPPPRLQEMPDDLPPVMPDESEVPQSGARSRRRTSAAAGRAAATSERPRAPQTMTPRRPVRVASPQSDEPVVYRRTTVELLPPTDSNDKRALLTPPSYSRAK